MSILAALNEARRKRKDVLDAAGAILTRAAKNNRSCTHGEDLEFDRRHAEGERLLADITRMEKQLDLERGLKEVRHDPRTAGREDILSPYSAYETRDQPGRGLDPQESDEIRTYLRVGTLGFTEEQRTKYDMRVARRVQLDDHPLNQPSEVRNLSAITGTAGAYTVPQGFQYELDVALKKYGGMMDVAQIIRTDQGNLLPYPSINDTTNEAEQIAEAANATLTAANTTPAQPTFGVVNLSAYMFDSGIIQIPIQLLDDSAFDLDGYLVDALTVRLGRKLNDAFTFGNGVSFPNGITNSVTVGWTASTPTGFTYGDLLGIEHSVDPAYRRQGSGKKTASWMFHDQTLLALKKLTDNNGRPLFIAGGVSQGIQGDAPDTLDGYPIVINQSMPQLGSADKTILFGDLSKYKIRMVRDTRLIRMQERYIDQLMIGMLCYVRADGALLDSGSHPVKAMQQSVT